MAAFFPFRARFGLVPLAALALAEPNVQRAMEGKEPRRVIVRAPKLVNVVI